MFIQTMNVTIPNDQYFIGLQIYKSNENGSKIGFIVCSKPDFQTIITDNKAAQEKEKI